MNMVSKVTVPVVTLPVPPTCRLLFSCPVMTHSANNHGLFEWIQIGDWRATVAITETAVVNDDAGRRIFRVLPALMMALLECLIQ